jgi:integrase
VSVYKPAKSPYFHYDFQFKGRRFYGSTGQTTRRKAEDFERLERSAAASGGRSQVARMPLDLAAGKWWAERGIHRGDAVDIERRLGIVLRLIGPDTPLGEIDQPTVSDAVERRRGETFTKSKAKDAKRYPVSPSTVNRDVIETLRPILKRARTHWTPKGQLHGLPDLDWAELRLGEPRALSRIYSAQEREAWLASCDDADRLALDLMLTYGLRYGELFFPLDAFTPDPTEATLALQKGRKRDVILYLPVIQRHAREIAARVSRARAAGLEHIWFYQDAKGDLVSYTYGQVEYRLSKAADAAGIPGGRRIHGARHHAGSAILQKTGNLKAVQSLLGHASINSSQRYAHVLIGDLRSALEGGESRNSPEPETADDVQAKGA